VPLALKAWVRLRVKELATKLLATYEKYYGILWATSQGNSS